MYFDWQIGVTLLVASIDLLLGVVILLQNLKNPIYIAYSFFALTVAAWGFGVGFFLATPEAATSDFLARFLYFAGGSIPASFLYFAYVFNAKRLLSFPRTLLVFLPSLLFVPLYFFTDLIIAGYSGMVGPGKGFHYGILHYLFDLHLWGYFLIAFFVLRRRYIENLGGGRLHTVFVIIGTYIVLAVAGVTNVLAPLFSTFDLIWIGPTATFMWVGIVSYAVLRHQLFNIRVIATELFVISLWLLLLLRIFVSEGTRDSTLNIVTFSATVVLGLFLIRGIIRDLESRERIEALAKDLAKANVRLKELDKLKSEFVSIASHQLRSPLTAIKGYASLLLEGSYGVIAGGAKEAIQKIFESSKLMVLSIEDFLNVSRIEQGRMTYDYSDFSIVKLTKDVAEELLPAARGKGLQLSFGAPREDITVHADLGKMKQVIVNLIDNAIKYTPTGTVDVKVTRGNNKRARVAVTDSGVGISKETMERLFDKFVRAPNANEVNVSGTGLGLYVAKQLIEAQGGKIWAESVGEGRGSTFFIELPIK